MNEQTTTRRRARITRALLPAALIAAGVATLAAATEPRGPYPPITPWPGKTKPRVALAPKPRTQSVDPGQSATFRLRIARRGGQVAKLKVLGPLPAGISVSLRPRKTRRRWSRLTVRTAGARAGTYRLRVQARSGGHRARKAVGLVIAPRRSTRGRSFAIAGDLQGTLEPGRERPLNLVLTNPEAEQISLTGLKVGIAGIDAPSADATHPCTREDFSITQFSGTYGFQVPGRSSRSLDDLGFPQSQWPRVTMLNRAVNQDGCKGASLSFRYGGTATGGGS